MLVTWVKKEGYALLDANLYPKPSQAPVTVGSQSRLFLHEVIVLLLERN